MKVLKGFGWAVSLIAGSYLALHIVFGIAYLVVLLMLGGSR